MAGKQVKQPWSHPSGRNHLKFPDGELTLWVRTSDFLPVRVGVADDRNRRLTVEFEQTRLSEVGPADPWRLPAGSGTTVERVARAHLERFIPAAISLLNLEVPTLGPATGEQRVVAREGFGRLEDHDGTKVLFLKGSPEEMGRRAPDGSWTGPWR